MNEGDEILLALHPLPRDPHRSYSRTVCGMDSVIIDCCTVLVQYVYLYLYVRFMYRSRTILRSRELQILVYCTSTSIIYNDAGESVLVHVLKYSTDHQRKSKPDPWSTLTFAVPSR